MVHPASAARTEPDRPSAWRPGYGRRFLLLQAAGWLTLASWWLAPTRALWDAIDLWFFRATNDAVALGTPWQILVALTSHRAFDLVAALYFVYLYLRHALGTSGAERLARLCRGGMICAWAALTLAVLARILEVDRLSPTLAVEGAFRLSEAVPYLKFKDVSGSSFPGDHGTALILFTVLGWHWLGARVGVAALAGSLLFVMPRLLSGAHWLTDVTVGSVLCACLSLSLVIGTPLGDWLVRLARKLLGWLPARVPAAFGSSAR